jgi:hypothetical protein
MSNELEQKAVEVVDKLIGGMDALTNFASMQIPDVAKQAISYAAVGNVITIVFCVLFSLSFAMVAKHVMRIDFATAEDGFWVGDNRITVHGALIMVFYGIVAADSVLVAMDCVSELIKIWIAPKVWLMEYTASLVK